MLAMCPPTLRPPPKAKRTGPGKPEPMRLEQGLLPCQLHDPLWAAGLLSGRLGPQSNFFFLFLTRFLHANRKSTSLENAMSSSEPIQDLVGPEALEPVQRLVQRRELLVRDAADLLHGLDVLLIERVDDLADFLALRGEADADRATINAASADDRGSRARRASSGYRRRWSRGSSRACAVRPRSVPCRRCYRAAAPAPN